MIVSTSGAGDLDDPISESARPRVSFAHPSVTVSHWELSNREKAACRLRPGRGISETSERPSER